MIPKCKLQKVMYGRRNVGSARLGCNVSDFKSGRPGLKLGDNKHYTGGCFRVSSVISETCHDSTAVCQSHLPTKSSHIHH